MEDILTRGLPQAQVLAAALPRQALELLGAGPVNLLIADVPWFDADYCNMIAGQDAVDLPGLAVHHHTVELVPFLGV